MSELHNTAREFPEAITERLSAFRMEAMESCRKEDRADESPGQWLALGIVVHWLPGHTSNI